MNNNEIQSLMAAYCEKVEGTAALTHGLFRKIDVVVRHIVLAATLAIACALMHEAQAQAPLSIAAPVIQPGQSLTQLASGDWLVIGTPPVPGAAAAPAAAMFVLDHVSGQPRRLTYSLRIPRSGHTATLLPDGRVLVLGGVNASGATGLPPELVDLESAGTNVLPDPGLIPRSQHTASLMSDGRILVTGGLDQADHALDQAEILDTQTFTTERFNVRTEAARFAHLAQWLPSNAVLLSGGKGVDGVPIANGEMFDVAGLRFAPVAARDVDQIFASLGGLQPALMVGSSPAQGAASVSTDSAIVLRFSKWMDPATLNTATVKLLVDGAETQVKVVAAERGMLLFVTPQAQLPTGVQVTLKIEGATDAGGQPMFATSLAFTTSSIAAPVNGGKSVLAQSAGTDSTFPNAASAASTTIRQSASDKAPTIARVAGMLGQLPLIFELNTGMYQPDTKFIARGNGYQLQLRGSHALLGMRQLSAQGKAMAADPSLRGRLRDERLKRLVKAPGTTEPTVESGEFDPVDIDLDLVGANRNPKITGVEPLASKTHYFYGQQASQSKVDVPHYAKVLHENIYPGIDQLYYGVQGKLEYDWIVKPGADPARIVQRVKGADLLSIDGDGDLVINAKETSIKQRRPIAYQMAGNVQVPVDAHFKLVGDTVHIEVAAYDKARMLVIDPIVDLATYLNSVSSVSDLAVANDGTIFVLGHGLGASTIQPTGAFPPANGQQNMYLIKLLPGGQQIDFVAAFLHVDPRAIAVDNSGTSPQAILYGSRSRNGTGEFLGKLSANGASMAFYNEYTTFTQPEAVRFDTSGNIFTLGRGTVSGAPPAQNNYSLPSPGAAFGCIVTKYPNTGGTAVFRTIVQTQCTNPHFTLDSQGHPYVVASGGTIGFPIINAPYPQVPCCGGDTGFAIKLAANGSSILYSTFLYAQSPASGDAKYQPMGVGVDSSDNLYVASAGGSASRGVIKYDPTGNIVFWNGLTDFSDSPALSDDNGDLLLVTPSGETYLSQGGTGLVHLDSSGNVQGAPFPWGSTAMAYLNGDVYMAGWTDAVTPVPIQNAVQPIFIGGPSATNGFLFKLVNHSVLTSTPNPSGLGQSVTLTYQALDTSAAGTVQFLDGVAALGSITMTAGVATFTTTMLAGGAHTLHAQFGSDIANAPQTVRSAASVVTLTGAATQTEAAISPIHVQVTAVGPAATGGVTLLDGSTVVGTGNLNAQGAADISAGPLPVGTHTFSAIYAGDSSYTPGTSPSLPVSVIEVPLVVTLNGVVSGSAHVIPSVVPIDVTAVSTSGTSVAANVFLSINSTPFAQGPASPFDVSWPASQTGSFIVSAYAISARGVRYDAQSVLITTTATGSATTYFHQDLSGNTIAASDESGQIVYTENYMPFGERINPQGSPDPTKLAELTGNRTWFHGKAQDESTGLSYFGARYYDPAIGRFMGLDAAGDVESNLQSFGRYTYGNNNPYRFIDPDGMDAIGQIGSRLYPNVVALGARGEPGSAGDFSIGAAKAAYNAVTSVMNPAAHLEEMIGIPVFASIGNRELAGAATFEVVMAVGGVAAAGLRGRATEMPPIKPGAAGGETAGKNFPESVKAEARAENPERICVFCRMKGTGNEVDHAIARSKGGDATIENAQMACRHCNASKGAREYPVTPPQGYRGEWPPSHWPQ